MGKKSGPDPPDPQDLASAATSTNIATAITNQGLQSGDRTGPGGSLTNAQTGTQTYTDPYTGESYDIPIFSSQQQFSMQQQDALDQAQASPQGNYGQTGTGGIQVGAQGQFNSVVDEAGQFNNRAGPAGRYGPTGQLDNRFDDAGQFAITKLLVRVNLPTRLLVRVI